MPGSFEVKGTREFRLTAAKLKAAGNGKTLTQEMSKRMRTAAQPAVDDAQDNVKSIDSKAGGRGGGSQARREFTLSRSRTQNERAKKQTAAGRGLRATIARAVRTTAKASGKSASVRVEVNTKLLPEDQRELPWWINAGAWRHPVFGNRETWVQQTVTPKGWFDRSMRKNGGKVRDGAVKVIGDINRKIAK